MIINDNVQENDTGSVLSNHLPNAVPNNEGTTPDQPIIPHIPKPDQGLFLFSCRAFSLRSSFSLTCWENKSGSGLFAMDFIFTLYEIYSACIIVRSPALSSR